MTLDLITVSETAAILGVSEATVRRMDHDGRLPVALRLSSGERLFDRAEVERIAKEKG